MNAKRLISTAAWADLARRTPLRGPLRRLWRLTAGGRSQPNDVSTGYRPTSNSSVDRTLSEAWQDDGIPISQRELVDQELRDMHNGTVVKVFAVAAEAVRRTGIAAPSVLELGCSSGYYGEVLETLFSPDIRYSGMDYSAAMVEEGRRCYPNRDFVQGDAVDIPFADASYDIVLSSALIMHVQDYSAAVREAARVARLWCIFHRTPVMPDAPTAWFEKLAYGVRVFEICFNEPELIGLFAGSGLELVDRLSIDKFEPTEDVSGGEMVTYVCRKA